MPEIDDTHVFEDEVLGASENEPELPNPSPAPLHLREPLLVVVAPFLVVGLGATVDALIAGEPLRAALIAGLSAVVGGLTRWVREQVTPLRDPKLAPGVPLRAAEE